MVRKFFLITEQMQWLRNRFFEGQVVYGICPEDKIYKGKMLKFSVLLFFFLLRAHYNIAKFDTRCWTEGFKIDAVALII